MGSWVICSGLAETEPVDMNFYGTAETNAIHTVAMGVTLSRSRVVRLRPAVI